MVLDYYKLAEQPFGVTPDSRFLYLGAQHREALASLTYGTESNLGFLALIAKPGMGKTSLLYHYLSGLRDKARTAFVFRTDCNSRELIRYLLLDLGIPVAGMDLPEMHDTLNRLLLEEMRLGRRFVLVIDEAQNLDEEVLESVRLLSNFETPWMKLMQIVLAGQPQLADRLANPSMAQLRQRISMVMRIEPFGCEDVNAYINHRLWVAGCENPSLFTVGARKLIAEHSEGIPRNINNLCFNAMSLGCASKRKTIDRDIIMEVIADMDLEPFREKHDAPEMVAAQPKQPDPVFFPVVKNRSIFSGWAPKLAVAGAVAFSLASVIMPVNKSEPRAVPIEATSSAAVVAPAPAALLPLPSAPAEAVSPVLEPAADSVQVMPGQTLYHITVKKLGTYNKNVLEEIRELNPWLGDPDHIQAGRKIRIPSAPSGPAQRACQ